jgi:hypothetical protein
MVMMVTPMRKFVGAARVTIRRSSSSSGSMRGAAPDSPSGRGHAPPEKYEPAGQEHEREDEGKSDGYTEGGIGEGSSGSGPECR